MDQVNEMINLVYPQHCDVLCQVSQPIFLKAPLASIEGQPLYLEGMVGKKNNEKH